MDTVGKATEIKAGKSGKDKSNKSKKINLRKILYN